MSQRDQATREIAGQIDKVVLCVEAARIQKFEQHSPEARNAKRLGPKSNAGLAIPSLFELSSRACLEPQNTQPSMRLSVQKNRNKVCCTHMTRLV